MSAAVTPIRESVRVARKNHARDDDAIRIRRMFTSTEAAAFADKDPDVLVLSWVMESKLPCQRLRLLAGTLDQRNDFRLRLAEAELTRAEYEVHSAKVSRTRVLHGKEAAEEMFDEGHRLLARRWQAVVDLANSPVFTASDLRLKRASIGTVWLRAEGERYEPLRAAVAADEARLNRKEGKA